MAACRLCGYQSPVTLCECPVCGEPCDASDGRDGAEVASGQGVEHAGDGVSRGTSPLKTQPWMGSDNANAFPSSCLNPELQSLLRLVPEEQNRKKRAQDAVRAVGGALVPSCSDEGQSGSDVVYVRPRIDPTMQVLKVRSNAVECAANGEPFQFLQCSPNAQGAFVFNAVRVFNALACNTPCSSVQIHHKPLHILVLLI